MSMRIGDAPRWELTLVAIVLTATDPVVAQDKPAEPMPIIAAAREAARSGRYETTRTVGFTHGGREFHELLGQGGILIGFDLGVGRFINVETIYALRPLYLTAAGQVAARDRGIFADRQLPDKLVKTRVLRTTTVRASPGYAVGAMKIRTGLNINGLSLTFMKIQGKALDPGISYTSPWIGDRTGGSETSFNGKGAPVIGIFGSEDEQQIKSIGFFFGTRPEAVAPPPPPVEPPPPEKPTEPKVEAPAKPPEPTEEPAVAPPPAPDVQPQAGAGINWLPYVIFGAVTLAVFAVLLVMLRKERTPAPVPQTPRPTAAPELGHPPAGADTPEGITTAALRAGVPAWEPQPWNPEPLPALPSTAPNPAAKEVATTLFTVAGLQFLCGMVAVALIPEEFTGGPVAKEVAVFMTGVILAIAAAFAGLGWWAWSQPLPAAISGLVLYLALFMCDIVSGMGGDRPEAAFKGIIIKIAIIAALVRAITVASKGASETTAGTSPGSSGSPPRPEDYMDGPVRDLLRQVESSRPPPGSSSPPMPALAPPPAEGRIPRDDLPSDSIRTTPVNRAEPEPFLSRPLDDVWEPRSKPLAQPDPPLSLVVQTPWWVLVGLWGIKDRLTAWICMGIAIGLAVVPFLMGMQSGDKRLYVSLVFIPAALWYWMCIRWMDENGGWSSR
jgi:hypothetical protein